MLNEWSDREPDPRFPRWYDIIVAAIVTIGTLGFIANLALAGWRMLS